MRHQIFEIWRMDDMKICPVCNKTKIKEYPNDHEGENPQVALWQNGNGDCHEVLICNECFQALPIPEVSKELLEIS